MPTLISRKSNWLLVALFVLALSATGLAQAPALAKFDEYLNTLAKSGNFSGTALIARDGKILFSKGYGMANLELDVPNTPQTKFRIGSITKQFTAAAIMLLQERGKLNVTDGVCKYFAPCPSAWANITVHHLLTHTSGIPSYTDSPEYALKMRQRETNEAMLSRFRDKPLNFQPGADWKYNNSGYFMLGMIVEKVSGESYESFLQKNIFTPLQMTNSGYDWDKTILKNRATGYSQENGQRVNSPYLDMGQPGGAGALYSTVEDLFKWNDALFNDKLLSAQTRAAMTTVVKNKYGYGLIMSPVHQRPTVSHGGGINGFNTFLVRFPQENVTIVVLRNHDFGAPGPGKMCNDLAALLFGLPLETSAPAAPPTERVVAKVDPNLYDAYVGQYELAPNFILTVTRDGDRLLTQATGQSQVEIFPESTTKFFLKVVNAQITFVKDATGKVSHAILHQGGDHQAKKIK